MQIGRENIRNGIRNLGRKECCEVLTCELGCAVDALAGLDQGERLLEGRAGGDTATMQKNGPVPARKAIKSDACESERQGFDHRRLAITNNPRIQQRI